MAFTHLIRNVIAWVSIRRGNWQVSDVPTQWNVICKLTITSMTSLRNFEVIFDKYNMCKICSLVRSSSQKLKQ